MSTTLTNGLKLPDKGSVDWYADMQNNYAILDGAVGTIAEHTTALAGKAPLVHTHTKSDITDFPAYGNAAGTICEGNDSRLSDARTPVAHTHTKSDVTDLLNSNFIPSANNSYDLGSSSYQWNNLYAKNYYYNGVAWGLDKANKWTQEQIYSTGYYGQMIWLQNTDLDLSVNGNIGLSGTYQQIIQWCDKNKTTYSMIQSWTNSSENVLVLRSVYRTDANTVRTSSIRNLCAANAKRFYPESDADTDLGITSNRWKTLNGINPGALSLPGTGGYTDIKGDITNLSGGDNTFTAPYDGWVCVKSTNATVIHIINSTWVVSQSATQSTAGTLCCLCPVMSGQSFSVIVNATSLDYAYIHPCKGNV